MSDGAYTDATVKSNAEFDKKLSPLALELADRIKALPKFCDREAIAAIIEPYIKILKVEGFIVPDGLKLSLDNGETVTATEAMCSRYTPVEGDYWVIQSDGYVYLNPKDVFERKYHSADGVIEIDENGKVTGPAGSEELLANIAAIRQA